MVTRFGFGYGCVLFLLVSVNRPAFGGSASALAWFRQAGGGRRYNKTRTLWQIFFVFLLASKVEADGIQNGRVDL